MNIQDNVSLAKHSTMRLGGTSRYFAEAGTEEDVQQLTGWAKDKGVRFMAIGDGSNIVWRDEGYDGLIIAVRIKGKEVVKQDEASTIVRLGAGENWDAAVAWAVEKNLSGIEFLSLIPGTVGGAPVQNIGAYGAELADVLLDVEVYDTKTESFCGILKAGCNFGYRTSRFKTRDKGRFIITGIVIKLNKSNPSPPFYESLQTYFDEHKISDYTPANVRRAVIAVRRAKLPDPAKVANNGSFFTNPLVSQADFAKLKKQYPAIKAWPLSDGRFKLAAGWLVEQAGFKGVHDTDTGMATWDKQALVLVNEHAKHTADLLKFRQKIIDAVKERFDVTLEQEPELLP